MSPPFSCDFGVFSGIGLGVGVETPPLPIHLSYKTMGI